MIRGTWPSFFDSLGSEVGKQVSPPVGGLSQERKLTSLAQASSSAGPRDSKVYDTGHVTIPREPEVMSEEGVEVSLV